MQTYADKILRLTVRLEQLAKSASADVQKIIKDLQRDVMGIIISDPINTQKALKDVQRQVKAISVARYSEIEKVLFEHETATAQAAHAAEIQGFSALGATANVYVAKLDVEKIVKNAFDAIMPGLGNGRQIKVKDMLERFGSYGTDDLMNIAERAYREGLSVNAITQMVRNHTGLQATAAEAVARTAIQAVANQARQETADSLPVDKEIWMATLDSKTCEYCGGLDGKCRPRGGFPVIAHLRCRCVKLYVPDDRSCSDVKKDLTRVERGPDGKSKPTGKYEDYGKWILTQPKSFQEEVLGIKRSKLLRDGDITFKKMYTSTGSRKTVADIEAHYL